MWEEQRFTFFTLHSIGETKAIKFDDVYLFGPVVQGPVHGLRLEDVIDEMSFQRTNSKAQATGRRCSWGYVRREMDENGSRFRSFFLRKKERKWTLAS